MSTSAVLVAVPNVMLNSLHLLSTYSITARRLLDYVMQGKITEADSPTIHLDATPSGLSVPPPPSPRPFFTPNALSATTLPIYPGLGQALNNAGMHTQWPRELVQRQSKLKLVSVRCSSFHPINNMKLLKKTHYSPTNHHQMASSFLHPPPEY